VLILFLLRYWHSEISGCRVNSSRHLFSNTLSPTLETNEIGKHTVELPILFLNPRSSDADFDSLTCKWVTCHVSTLISTPLICPRSKPPAQITNLFERSLKLTKHNRPLLVHSSFEYNTFHCDLVLCEEVEE